VVVLGRRAAAAGLTGALGEQDAGGWLADRQRPLAPEGGARLVQREAR
jgi:hypothetical protein